MYRYLFSCNLGWKQMLPKPSHYIYNEAGLCHHGLLHFQLLIVASRVSTIIFFRVSNPHEIKENALFLSLWGYWFHTHPLAETRTKSMSLVYWLHLFWCRRFINNTCNNSFMGCSITVSVLPLRKVWKMKKSSDFDHEKMNLVEKM
jgi:hypothetical protein